MKKVLISFILLSFVIAGHSQVSGYMGKKFSIISSSSISFPHLTGLYNTNKVKALPSFNQAISIEYLFTNTNAIGLQYKFAMNAGRNDLDYISVDGFKEKHKFTSHTFGTYIKMYHGNTLGPLGFYSKLGLHFQYLYLKDALNIDIYSNKPTEVKDYHQFDLVGKYTIGRNWLLFDNILLGLELESGFPFSSVFRAMRPSFKFEGNWSYMSSRYNMTTEFLKLSLNIGIIPF